jgi:hypothetical protein
MIPPIAPQGKPLRVAPGIGSNRCRARMWKSRRAICGRGGLSFCPLFEDKPLDFLRDAAFNAAPKVLMVFFAGV